MQIPFVIIGVTGPIGAGCTTLSKTLINIRPNKFIGDNGLLKDIGRKIKELSYELRSLKEEEESVQLHKLLHECLKERAYLTKLNLLEDVKFVRISMSELIVKLAIESVESDEFIEWKKNNEEVAIILEDLNSKWKTIIDIFNHKKYSNLEINELQEIDKMFIEIRKARLDIGKIEKQKYFKENKEIVGLYLQEFGDSLRKTGNAFSLNESPRVVEKLIIIAEEANKQIKYYRNRPDYKNTNSFVIDAFRNPTEVDFFRDRYDQFFLVSIHASETSRRDRFRKNLNNIINDIDKLDFNKLFKGIDDRDLGEGIAITEVHRQNVSRCAYLSDISINNDLYMSEDQIEKSVFSKFLKYYALIAFPGCTQPSRLETNMNLAYSLSLRSTCISRQVGAVITDRDGFVIGQGWNDVGRGQIGCGLRIKEDYLEKEFKLFGIDLLREVLSEDDLGGYTPGNSICFKDVISEKKINEKIEKIFKDDEAAKKAKELKIKRLEYCRALHAEENALLQVAARGGIGVAGGIIYTTTFPCELCAKKIYQSGIKTIIYTEPYPDSISESVFLKDGIGKIEIKPFEGIKSSGYYKLYKPSYDKKDAQKLGGDF